MHREKIPDYAQGKWADAFAPRKRGERRHWLVKSEPDVFSFDDLWNAPDRTTCWDGVRNHAARNFLRDGMKLGDHVMYYHSMADPQAIVGICEVVREGYPDHTALDPASDYHDPDATADDPRWYMVDVRAVERLPRPVTLAEIKRRADLAEMALVRVSRLSVIPVTTTEWETIRAMAADQGAPAASPAKGASTRASTGASGTASGSAARRRATR